MTITFKGGTDDTMPAGSTNAVASARGELAPGTVVGEHEVQRLLGVGGCSMVYLARHQGAGRLVALKVLHLELVGKSKMIERFVREVRVVNVLKHPSIVAIYDLGKLDDGRPFYVMEYLPGTTLDGLIRARGRIAADEALDIIEPVCSALQAAHDVGIVHRDIKPSNVAVVEAPGAKRRVIKLLDFGVAKLTDPEMDSSGLTSVGRCIGTLAAMAPEQIMGSPVDARTDIYALGVLLFRMLTGRAPFDAVSSADLALQHIEAPAPKPSLLAPVRPSVDAVVLRCMEKTPDRRFSSVESFLDALREAVGKPIPERESQVFKSTMALGICVSVSVDASGEEFDDTLAEDIGMVMDAAEEALRCEGFALVLTTGSVVLGARPLPDEGEPQRRDRLRALDAATALYHRLAERSSADARLRVAVVVHVDRATVRGTICPEVVGGPVTQMGARYVSDDACGLYATPEALDGLTGVSGFKSPISPC